MNRSSDLGFDSYGLQLLSEFYFDWVGVADRYFGGFCLGVSIIAAAMAWNGRSTWSSFGVIAAFTLVNLGLSRIALLFRGKPRIRVEIFRIFGVNSILAPMVFLHGGGIFSPFWQIYLIPAIGTGFLLGALYPSRAWQGVLGVAYWSMNLCLVWILKKQGLKELQLVPSVGILLMTGLVVLQLTRRFLETAREEHQNFSDALLQLKFAQAQLVESGKLSALGQMAGSIAHEINSPLATIHLAIKQIRRATDAPEPDKTIILDRAQMIQTVVERIARIVVGLRSFCRDGSSEPFRLVPVREIISETLVFCEERFRSRAIALHVDAEGLDVQLECRPVEISQVLLNLLNNAFDAIHSDPTLPDKSVAIRTRVADHGIQLIVEDSGSGIPPRIRQKMFEPFFTTKSTGSGTGLGLSISRRIIEKHGGSLSLDADAPHTRFVIDLPAIQRRA